MSGAPFDPFQSSRPSVSDPFQKITQRWMELTHQIDNRAGLADPRDDNALSDRLWREREDVEAQVLAIAEPTLAGIALKLRIVAWHMNVTNAECANHDGVRTNELDDDENIVASALAGAERLVGGAS